MATSEARRPRRKRNRKKAGEAEFWCVLLTDRRKLGQPVRAISLTGGMTVQTHRVKVFRSFWAAAAFLKRWSDDPKASEAVTRRRRRFLATVEPWHVSRKEVCDEGR